MKRIYGRVIGLAVICGAAAVIAIGTTTAGASGSMSSSTGAASGLGSQLDVAKTDKVTLTLWWLGNQEVPGIEKWMAQTISKYHALHPDVTVKTVIESTGTWTTTQKTACKGRSGPDIWYNWAGTWSLEQVWAGCTVPNESVLSPADLAAVKNIAETRWDGKTWVYPLYRFIYPVVYNQTLFKKAHLNPNKPPTSWAQFIAACKKLKAAGITPIALGLKDGFGGEIVGSATFQKQLFSNYSDLIKMVVNGNYTAPFWKSWIEHAAQLKPYVNNDVNSIAFGDGLGRFENGKAAMVFGTPGVQATIAQMVKAGKKISVMKPPVFGTGAYANSLVNTGNGFQVTSWSKNKSVAGNFLAYMHTPKRLAALYAQTGNFPADSRWNPSQAKRQTDRLMLGWLAQKSVYYPANYYPTDLDVNGNFVVFQGLLGGKMTVDQAAHTYESVITKWRKLHAADIENYRKWAG
jgi:raffinose/stachyose/melibiose transport system substrate-binding protein